MELHAVERFITSSNSAAELSTQWDTWKRSLQYYLDGKGITNDARRKALLLHCAGPQVQEIYETLNGSGNSLESAIKALDGYFKLLINKFYERFRFRQLVQDPDKPIDKFVSRLRHQAAKCSFADTDDSIIDRIISKCAGSRLRSKLLEEGNALTLARALVIARTGESVAVQDKDIASEQNSTEPSLMSSAL